MNTKTKKLLLLTGLILLPGLIFAFEPISTSELLTSYLQNDDNLKKYAIELRKAELSLDSTRINNGFDITLSTGNVSIFMAGENTSISVKPSVQASLPQASNLTVTASSAYTYKNAESKITDTKLNSSIDIISSTGLNREISLLKAERNLTEAKRKLQNQAVSSEKAFYTELKALINSTSNIINLQKTLYTNKIDFEKIKTQGYSTGSSTYRLAQMKVLSSEHEIENSTRALIHSYIVFYKKCGYDITIEDSTDFYDLLPQDIAEVTPLDIHSFDEDSYTEIESALWTNKINTMQRKANTNFSLAANGGVTLNNSTTNSTTADAGISTSYGGLNMAAGVSIPIGTTPNPAITLSATVSPNNFRLNSITEQTNELNEETELLAIESARSNFATKIVDCEQSLADLEWTKKSDRESYEMYDTLEKDLASWYKEGFVTESEYLSAKVNKQSYTVKQIINKIDFIIYNDELITMFVLDGQENYYGEKESI